MILRMADTLFSYRSSAKSRRVWQDAHAPFYLYGGCLESHRIALAYLFLLLSLLLCAVCRVRSTRCWPLPPPPTQERCFSRQSNNDQLRAAISLSREPQFRENELDSVTCCHLPREIYIYMGNGNWELRPATA